MRVDVDPLTRHIKITTSTGEVFRIRESTTGGIKISTAEGLITVRPVVANSIELEER